MTQPNPTTAERTRILFVHGTLEIGGAEEVRLSLLSHLDRSRYEATVCCLRRGGAIADEAAALGYEVIVLGRRAHALSLPTLTALRRVIRKHRPHIVQTSLPRASYWGRIAAMLEGVPVVIVEEHTVSEQADWARPFIESLLGRHTDCVLTVSASVRDAVCRKDRARRSPSLVVIPNPVHAERLRARRSREAVRQEIGVGPSQFLIAHVGRMDRARGVKGHDILIECMAILRRTHPDMACALVGDGPGRPYLEATARALGVADQMRFLGYRRDVADLLVASDLFVLPSRVEGMSVALMEAMWMGTPPVASSIPSSCAVLCNGEYGRLVKRESPSELARVVAELAADPKGRLELGRKARAHAHDAFAPERYAQRVAGLWEHLLAEKGARAGQRPRGSRPR